MHRDLMPHPLDRPSTDPVELASPEASDGEHVDGLFGRVATTWRAATSLETLVRPLLDAVLELTSLDIAYLTVRHADGGLEHRFIADPTDVGLPEGFTIPWTESLCKLCQDTGRRYTHDVGTDLPGSAAAAALGVHTFLSVPVVSNTGELMGTLCSAARLSLAVRDTTLAEVEVLARLIGDWMVQERQLEAHRHRAAEAEAALEARSLLIAQAEHQLKTPLTLLSGWAQSMEERWEELDAVERREGLGALRRAADRLHHDVERLLDEARMDMLVRRLDLGPVDVGVVATQVVEQVQSLTRDHGLSLVVGDAVVALADEEAIRQALLHLVENAVKYSPAGGRIEVSVHRDLTRAALEVVVSDEGIGIDENVDIFEPFVRGAEARRLGGTGLGLHIVSTLVTSMAGRVEASWRPEGGSRFTVVLPAAMPDEPATSER